MRMHDPKEVIWSRLIEGWFVFNSLQAVAMNEACKDKLGSLLALWVTVGLTAALL